MRDDGVTIVIITCDNNNCKILVPIAKGLVHWNRVLGICWEFVFGEISKLYFKKKLIL